jgi:hypothetical protein
MAGRIFDRLAQHFGKSNLFIDIDNVPFGVDFRKQSTMRCKRATSWLPWSARNGSAHRPAASSAS